MVRDISAVNSITKKAALGVMLAGSVAAFASNPVRTVRPENPAQTEVVSKTGAEAMKALAYPQQQKSDVPTVRNKKVDEKFLKFFNTPKEKKEIDEALLNIYKENGSYLGAVIVQQNLDLNMFKAFLNCDIEILKNFNTNFNNRFSEYNGQNCYEVAKKLYTPENEAKIKNLKDNLYDWVNENYFKIYTEPCSYDHVPWYEELSQNLSDFSSNNELEFSPGKKMFSHANMVDRYNYINGQLRKSDNNYIQKHMDEVATLICMLDIDLFDNMIHLIYPDDKSNIEMYYIFDMFMECCKINLSENVK